MKKILEILVRKIPRKQLIKLSYIFNKAAPLLYFGNKVYCPVCNNSFRKFLPYGNVWRDNRLCPKCFSLERHRMIWHFLKNETDLFRKNLKMLHIAPEQCFFQKFRKMKNIDYITADLESPLADVKMDIINMPFEDNEFDVIFCNHVLEHIEDDHKAMTELFRVLKKDGFAILQVPLDERLIETFEDPTITDPQERKKKFWAKDHVRLYGLDYPKRLENAGFKVENIKYAEKLDDETISKQRLLKELSLFVCRKQ